jgi:DNA mismatch repair protein MutL
MIDAKRIHQLPNHLANQIAAGEVVERPASVLKELLENSLDADSRQIEISIERGGIGLIRVQDDGVGICKEDLKLALLPHATSKIATLSDLEGVISYGFRGEALASIGSVSRLLLSSCVKDQEFGWSIQLEGRDASPTLMPVPKRQGTLIEVRDLFYNTPARRKFLRSEKTEMNYLEEVFKRIALSQPEVSFKFQRGDHIEKRLPVCRNLEAHTRRVALLCGQGFIDEAYYIQADSNGLKLKGWLGSIKAMRSQTDLQYFYVNGRIVRDKVVMHAIRQAYQDLGLPGRYPAYVLYFELDPTAVDVNVHPTKHEVRFREARTVHAFLSYAVEESLKQGFVKNQVKIEGKSQDVDITIPAREKSEALDLFSEYESKTDRQDLLHKNYWDNIFAERVEVIEQNPSSVTNLKKVPVSDQVTPVAKAPVPSTSLTKVSSNRILSVLGGELLLVENEKGLMVVDLKATRSLYLKTILQESYQANNVAKRPLLIPKSIVVKHIENLSSIDTIDWDRLGFEFTEAGVDSILVRSVPELFGPKLEYLPELFAKLFTLQAVEPCIDIMVQHIVSTQTLNEKDINQLLMNIENPSNFKGPSLKKHYREMSFQQLREVLF